jgi:small subunit ribosomal protein S16
MLKIRLARHGRKKLPFYRIVLTEHTKPAQSGYKLVLWRFNPLSHTMEANVAEIKEWISKWAQPTERVAKLLFADTKDSFFKDYFVERESTKWKEIQAKKIAEEKLKKEEIKAKQEDNVEEVKNESADEEKEEVKEEAKEDVKEEDKEEVKEDAEQKKE